MTWILIILIAAGYLFGLHGYFEKAGEAGWKAWVPYLRIKTWLKLTDKPKWWIILSFIPLVNLFVYADLLGQSSDSMRRYSLWEHGLIIFLGFVWFPFLTWNDKTTYFGPKGVKPGEARPPKSTVRQWVDALVFALFAAYLIRSFTMELYRIPTQSMEGTLLTGDFLFVSKFHYGVRIPNTPLAFPLVHHSFPPNIPLIGGKKAYLEWLHIPYTRLPGIHDVRRNDMVVFNLPVNDTTTKELDSREPYYSLINKYRIYSNGKLSRKEAENAVRTGVSDNRLAQRIAQKLESDVFNLPYNQALALVRNGFTVIDRPVDKRENYIKRCVAIPGDTLEIKEGYLHINGALAYQPEHKQYLWVLAGVNEQLKRDPRMAYNEYGIFQNQMGGWLAFGSDSYIAELKERNLFTQAVINQSQEYEEGNLNNLRYFPYSTDKTWTTENFGPLVMPKKGKTMPITPENAAVYKRAILVYEGGDYCWKEGMLYENDCSTPLTEYTFTMDYYWLMGDNRHNSQDSRFWGFVPEDHVVGKAWFVVLSTDKDGESFFKRIRWNRFFKGIHKNWAPKDDKYRY